MNVPHNSTDSYYIFITNKILNIAPIVGVIAAITFTFSRLLGWFETVPIPALLSFDIICCLYFVVAHYFIKKGIVTEGTVNPHSVYRINIILDCLVLLQWNLISYIFPVRELWGFAPMFVLLTAFMFNKFAVLLEIAGISVSILVSWFVKGNELLPVKDASFALNVILRIIALIISFVVIYLLTLFAEKFTVTVKINQDSLTKKNQELESIGNNIIDFTADIIEERDSTSGSHVKRIKTYTKILGKQIQKLYPEYNLNDEKIELISKACVLHDVGKIGIPDSILLKPDRLTPEEFEIIKTHTILGEKIINKLPDNIGDDFKHYCRDICLFHHERYDGKGYPAGLQGENIPISAQIVSVMDCYDALTNIRPYKTALPGNVAINMILNGECGAFSEKMKNAIIACKEELLNT